MAGRRWTPAASEAGDVGSAPGPGRMGPALTRRSPANRRSQPGSPFTSPLAGRIKDATFGFALRPGDVELSALRSKREE